MATLTTVYIYNAECNYVYLFEGTLHLNGLLHFNVCCVHSVARCQLFLALLSEHAEDLGLEVHSSLPLVTPLPIPSTSLLFVELEPLAYLMVGVAPGMVDQYYLLQLCSISRGLQGFWKVASLLELDTVKLQVQQLSIIPGVCVCVCVCVGVCVLSVVSCQFLS